ncbi:hypothetical protein CABS02_14196 [Colletotrichum abscissum]|uniref:Uncharacterized protein n=1 Tax=Colletotrichum abscissum TaxID=1671311 RepID=A0A9P9X1S6_9PEZI|nr:hypothetical protein CABS02_14196 [Colletotrichum abscissum]
MSKRSGHITVHTSLQADNSYTVYAAEAYRNERRELLSANGKNLLEAFENLHKSSAQEVYQFTEANGCAFPLRSTSSDDESDPDFSASSDTEASTADPADVIVLSDSPSNKKDNTRRKQGKFSPHRRKYRQKKKRLRRDASSTSEEEEFRIDSRPTNVKTKYTALVSSPRHHKNLVLPTVASKAYSAGSGGILNGHNGQPLAVRALPPPPPPPPRSIQPMMQPPHPQNLVRTPVPSTTARQVRLVIKWHGHGDHLMIWQGTPSYTALRCAALAQVSETRQAFDNVSASEFCSSSLVVEEMCVEIGDKMYSISTAGGDDMSVYFRMEIMPKFVVVVGHHRGVASSSPAQQPQ